MGSERFSPFSTHFSSFSAHFSPFSALFSAFPKGQGQTTAIYCKNGEFHSDPVCTDPVQNFLNLFVLFLREAKPGCFQTGGFPTLRAKGTLISEPRFSTPCEMRFFPREKGKTAFFQGFSFKRLFSLSRVGKIASRRG